MLLFTPDLIRRKRNGEKLAPEEIRALIADYTEGALPDYQMAALLMAIYFQGLDDGELEAWTLAMLDSGQTLDLTGVPGTKVDKHSTGGVGDKISICLAPAVACLGVPVPMISGRGLGHTGGTLDKLEAIPGFRVDLPAREAAAQLDRLGLFLIGQTAALAPADRKLYALRDVTATVESIPLIASSIMSKKLAEGIDALVLDVKTGEGAFMPEIGQARRLARTMIRIGERAGKQIRALITDMGSPIGLAVGNAVETAEAIAVMAGEGPPDTVALTEALGAEMLLLGGKVSAIDEGRKAVRAALLDGRALACFRRVVEAQGGDPRVCDDPGLLPKARARELVKADRSGHVARIRPRAVAQAALLVGAGRSRKEDPVDPSAGVVLSIRVGDAVERGAPLAALHHNGAGRDAALAALETAFEIADDPPMGADRILETVR